MGGCGRARAGFSWNDHQIHDSKWTWLLKSAFDTQLTVVLEYRHGTSFGPGITPDLFNRHQIGRVLDTIFESDGSALFSQLSKGAGRTENVETRVQSLDTTSFSTFGEYPESDDELPAAPQLISITYGHSKDRRPDLSPAVVELIVSQDGRVATFMKWHDRNASDSVICRKRTKVLVADSKLYSKENTEWLAQTEFITPIPSTNKLEKELTMKAVAASEMWCRLPNN